MKNNSKMMDGYIPVPLPLKFCSAVELLFESMGESESESVFNCFRFLGGIPDGLCLRALMVQ